MGQKEKRKATKKNSKGKKNSKKSKPKKTYPPTKLISQFNPYYPKKKAMIIRNTSASYCKFKRGFLYLVKNSKKLGTTPLQIHVVPVYVSLSMFAFKIQMGLSGKTLFSTVKTKNILKITKKFKNANCFEVVEDEVSETSLTQSPVVLCAASSKNMMGWVKALQEFKDCLYNNKYDGSRTLLDFNRINTLIKAPKAKVAAKKVFNPLYYQNSPIKKKKVVKKVEYVMKRQLAKIVGLMERGRMNKQRLTRKMNTKLKSAKKIEYDIRSKQNLITKIMDKRQSKEKNIVNKIRVKVHKKKKKKKKKRIKIKKKKKKKKKKS